MEYYNQKKQFELERGDFFQKMSFINWYRYFFIISEIQRLRPRTVLEVGPGEGTIKRVCQPFVDTYSTMDVNENLSPDFRLDVRKFVEGAVGKFDVVVAADILEHIPFSDTKTALMNICSYLKPNGRALITIPHRASYFLWMDPRYIPKTFRVPTGFLSLGSFYRRFIKRKIWIDPDHQWEIGDGNHTIKDVEKTMLGAGLAIEKRQTLPYVDFWIVKK